MKKDIAIIGMSGRFPKSASIKELWDNLYNGEELIHFFTEKELEEKGVSLSDRQQPNFVGAGSFVSDTEKFDYPLFRYTVHEAGIMDPQTRLMHQLVWEALEDAGCTPETYHKKTGIFMGANKNLPWSVYATVTPVPHVDDMTKRKLSNPNFMASLIAYKFNFKGPCYFIDTACSTSLSTAHLACRSLLLNECGIAVVGGARLSSDEEKGYFHQEGGITSRDGHNKTFDSTSSGTIACDAAGVVILKRLEDALLDGDDIYAVIKGSAMNNDGSEKGGYTMPSIQGQAECIRLAHKISGVSPTDVTYVEAHGTATRIGDPIEVEALNIAFNNDTTHKCALSTIKSNMGHADEAAGVSGLIKTALAIHHRTIPGSLHFNQANPAVNFSGGPFYVNASTAPWKGTLLTAGVSSFGIGGTNVHMVLQEVPTVSTKALDRGHQVFRISAASPEALERYEIRLQDFLRENPAADINSIACTLQTGRRSLDYRKCLVAASVEGLIQQLTASTPTHTVMPGHHMVFMFSGQGAQYVNMGRELYEKYPGFREQLDKGLALLQQHNNIDFKSILFNESDDKRLHDTLYTQPLLFVLEYALAMWLIQLGIRPDYMIGHSLGEYVAATISGVFSFEDAVRLISQRAALMFAAETGEMLSVAAPLSRLDKDLLTQVAVAAVNTQDSCVLSGTHSNMALVKEKLAQLGISAISLQTSHAFHSPMMEPVIAPFKAALSQVKLHAPAIPFVSNVSGKLITAEQAQAPDYWCEHLLSTVYFEKGLQTLLELDRPVFVEIGPGRTLASFINRVKGPANEAAVLTTIRHQRDQVADTQHFASFLGNVWVNGYDIDWNVFYGDTKPSKLHLPTYSFDPLVITAKVTLSDSLLQHQSTATKTLTEAYYIPAWKHSPLPVSSDTLKNILFFNDGSAAASQLLEALVAAGHEVTEVLKSTSFDTSIPGRIFLDTASEYCMDRLLECLQSTTTDTVHIVYAWALSSHADSSEDYQMLLELLKACRDVNMRFTFLCDRNFQVSGNETAGSLQQHTAALLQVAAQENAAFNATVLDLDTTTLTEKDIRLIQQEIARGTQTDKVAIRYGRRWEQRFDVLQKTASMLPILPQEGVCVITGNLDELVWSLAEMLQKDYAAKVVICTDSHTSIPKSFDQLGLLPGISQIRQFDLTDTDSWLSAIEAIESEFGTINGVIHAAKYNGDIALINDITLTAMVHHFEARVDVLQTLLHVFANRGLDFFRVFSTLSAFVGGISYGLYASAAALMDALALREYPGLPQPVVINPDRLHKDAPWIQYTDLREILHLSFAYPEIRQIVVSKREVNHLASKPVEETTPKVHTEINRRHLANGFKAPESPTELKIAGMMEDIFGAKGIGADDDFFEMGGDSLKALMLINRIRKETGADIAIQEMFENKTTAKLAFLTDERLWLTQENNAINELII
ncbi:acyl transferase domain-containing protein [Chitinophaga dinghuensis]|uniref:Acyl transferase domain-containing protein n=1 Tax=Chitinophaga dinghuensis TaxID=1539050 RepID=A0A327VQP5_9BACT|nr:type I polyketide synthase [Chitinophaga dinghuensis]RAJ76806.1 acyl transferase domain-containing protein [Chitinophaga dinghuensis]